MRQVIPAQPGWRLVQIWMESNTQHGLKEEPIIAWERRELEHGAVEYRPVLRFDGECTGKLADHCSTQDDSDDFNLGILAPGESLNGEDFADKISDYLNHHSDAK